MAERAIETMRAWLARREATPLAREVPAWRTTCEGSEVVLEVVHADDALAREGVRVVVPLASGLEALAIVAEGSALSKKGRAYTGDAVFDDAVVMHVPRFSVYGAFDAALRPGLQTLVARGVVVSGGALRLGSGDLERLAPSERGAVVAAMARAARALSLGAEEAALAIARIIEEDPLPSVRATYDKAFGEAPEVVAAKGRLAIAPLLEGDAPTAERASALRRIARDPAQAFEARRDAWLGLVALPFPDTLGAFEGVPPRVAVELLPAFAARLAQEPDPDAGRHGARALCRVVASAGKPSAEVALKLLGALAPHGVREALELCLASSMRLDDHVVRASFSALLRLTEVPAEEILAALSPGVRRRLNVLAPELLAVDARAAGPLYRALLADIAVDLGLAETYLVALARAHAERPAEPPLEDAERAAQALLVRRFLESSTGYVQAAACAALGELGARDDAAHLAPFGEGFFRSGRVKDAARAGMRRIAERHGVHQAAGALALAGHERGTLALSDAHVPDVHAPDDDA